MFFFFSLSMFCQASLPPPLTSSSAEPTVTRFIFFLLLSCWSSAAQQLNHSCSSRRFPLWQHRSLQSYYAFKLFLHCIFLRYCQYTRKKTTIGLLLGGASHWTVAIVTPGWPRGRANEVLLSPREASPSHPPSLCSTGLPPPCSHISAPPTATLALEPGPSQSWLGPRLTARFQPLVCHHVTLGVNGVVQR